MKIQKSIIYFLIFSSIFINPLNLGIIIKKKAEFSFNNNFQLNSSVPYINLSKLPPIDYKSIYEEWYHTKIEMLIITPDNESFINAVKPLEEWKNEKGVKTIILSNFSLYNGRDKAEKIRNMIKDFYQQENIQWVLLAGDATEDLIPTRYVYNPDTVEYGGSEYNGYDEYYKPTDYYYADLSGSWDDDGDGNWGESSKYNSQGKDEINWVPEVYVGRFPASTALELEIMVNKSLNYEKNPYMGEWMNQMLLAGGISSY
ncbi:MAG: C25 family cysteine peptidase, partial [Promethearchaeota archaeon]